MDRTSSSKEPSSLYEETDQVPGKRNNAPKTKEVIFPERMNNIFEKKLKADGCLRATKRKSNVEDLSVPGMAKKVRERTHVKTVKELNLGGVCVPGKAKRVEDKTKEKTVTEGKGNHNSRQVAKSYKIVQQKTFEEKVVTQRKPIDHETIFVLLAFEVLWIMSMLTELQLKKKAFVWATLILFLPFSSIMASPVEITTKDNENEYKILKTSQCDGIDFLRPHQCERNNEMIKVYNDFCGFSALCDPGSKPICIGGGAGEAIFICSTEKLKCKKGYRRKVRMKEPDSDIIVVKEEKCPDGQYQPTESDCNNACTYRHGNIEELPEQYAIYYPGDNVSPPLIYCDFKRGFYSPFGRFLNRYDSEMRFDSFQCINVDNLNPCSGEMFPLPDGTCIEPCEANYTRGVYDNFKCSDVKVIKRQQKTEKKIDTQDNEDNNENDRFSPNSQIEKKSNSQLLSEITSLQNWHVTVVIVMVIAALLFAIGSVFLIYNMQKEKTGFRSC